MQSVVRPSFFAAVGVSRPVTSCDSTTGGNNEPSSCSLVNNFLDHFRLTTSKNNVPEASDTSVTNSPVKRRRISSLGSNTAANRSKFFGS